MANDRMVTIENINTPGRASRVNAAKYAAMREALLKALPQDPPGVTQQQMRDALTPFLNQDLWPGGRKATWWMKTVQLDLEAKGLLLREKSGRLTRWRVVRTS